MKKIRKPVVAGQFYESTKESLRNQIEKFVDKKAPKNDVIGCIMPHAGYMFSGPVAGAVAQGITIKDTVILLGPNHTGYGKEFSIMTEGIWQTPLGEVKINSHLADYILKHSEYLQEDTAAHEWEHSLEVELPFLQYFRSDFEIVPVSIHSNSPETLASIGDEIGTLINERRQKDSTLILASSDMTHYEPQDEAREKDKEAIEAILKLDEDELTQKVRRYGITMCGYAPVIILLRAVKKLGAGRAELIKYLTSGDVSGDYESVVGYAGITLF